MNNFVVNIIKDGLKDLGIPKARLARQIGMSPQQLNNILNGASKMPIEYFPALALYLILDRETLKQAFIEDVIEEIEEKICKQESKQ